MLMMYTEFNFWKYNFQETVSPLAYGIVDLHDHILFFLSMILFMVLFLCISTMYGFFYSYSNKLNFGWLQWQKVIKSILQVKVMDQFVYRWLKINHGTLIELIWTVIPSFILILIAIPSFALLYGIDEIVDPTVTIKVVGHQWYWSYEYSDYNFSSLNYFTVKFFSLSSLLEDLSSMLFNNLKLELNNLFPILELMLLNDQCMECTTYRDVIQVLNGSKVNNSYFNMAPISEKNWISLFVSKFVYNSSLLGSTYNFNFDNKDFMFYKLFYISDNFNFFMNDNEIVFGEYLFDSYMVQENDLLEGDLRLLKTDHPLVLPKNVHMRFIMTSEDVLHSWAVPSLGLKVDAVPGRLNQVSVYIKSAGIFYGQCSELCGVNHAFMPMELYGFTNEMYTNYMRWAVVPLFSETSEKSEKIMETSILDDSQYYLFSDTDIRGLGNNMIKSFRNFSSMVTSNNY